MLSSPSVKRAKKILAILALVFTLNGCGGSSKPSVYQTSGEVFYQGKPADGAQVVFFPMNSKNTIDVYPGAIVNADGSFKLTSYKNFDGAPEGEYAVVIIWDKRETVDGDIFVVEPDKFGGKFNTAERTDLRATVKKGKNQIPRFAF